jgi:hypothetical protein
MPRAARVPLALRAIDLHGPTAEWLRSAGWWVSDSGWRHKAFVAPWPDADAIRVQKEADEGGQDLVHRALRGEA